MECKVTAFIWEYQEINIIYNQKRYHIVSLHPIILFWCILKFAIASERRAKAISSSAFVKKLWIE